jgi:hypothetical protein
LTASFLVGSACDVTVTGREIDLPALARAMPLFPADDAPVPGAAGGV